MAQDRRKENVRQMIVRFTLDEGAYAPEKAHASDAGYDLRSREEQRITDCCGGRADSKSRIESETEPSR